MHVFQKCSLFMNLVIVLNFENSKYVGNQGENESCHGNLGNVSTAENDPCLNVHVQYFYWNYERLRIS